MQKSRTLFIITREEDALWIQSQTDSDAAMKADPDLRRDPRASPALRIFQPSDSFEHEVMLYNADPESKIEYSYVLLKDGEEINRGESNKIDARNVQDIKRIPIRNSFEIGKGMAAGNYVLLITVNETKKNNNKPIVARQAVDFEIRDAANYAE
jgi:hypothetical protein